MVTSTNRSHILHSEAYYLRNKFMEALRLQLEAEVQTMLGGPEDKDNAALAMAIAIRKTLENQAANELNQEIKDL